MALLMAGIPTTKPGRRNRRRGESRKRNGGASPAPPSAAANPPENLLSGASERQILGRFSDRALMAFLAIAAALPYLNTLGNGLVADDEMQLLHNPYIRNFHYLPKIFTTWAAGYFPGMPDYYRPLMNLGYLLCYQVFDSQAFGYHLANLALNSAVVCAAFLLTKRLFRNRDLALVAAALFAFHPIHTEAVAWVAASPDMELGFFYLLTFWFFLGVARPGGKFSSTTLLAMSGSFLLALLSKEQAVTLPTLATVYEHFYRPDRQETSATQKVKRYAALWLLTGVYLLFRIFVLGALSSGASINHITWYQTFLSTILLLGQHLWTLLWPVSLHAFCAFHPPSSLFDPAVVAGLIALAVCGLLIYFLWRPARLLSFGVVWFLVILSPVLNARWMVQAAFEERYLYLPSVGICWLLAWGFLRLRARASRRNPGWRPELATAFGVLMALCLFRIVTRNRDWLDSPTLYANTLAACPDSYYIRRDLGAIYWERGDIDSAKREWLEAFKTNPTYSLNSSSLGLVYLREQSYPQALEYFKKALELDPSSADAHLNVGVTYMNMQSLELAEPELRTAVRLKPLSSAARNALGKLYLDEGRMAEAEEQFRQSVEIEPNIAAYGNLGLIHWRRGEATLAEQQWRQALRLAPNDSSILNNLGLVCTKLQRYPEAVSFFRKAIQLSPNDPSPHSNLGITYMKSGQQGLAETEFRAALPLAPQKYETRNRLGMLYLEGGRVEEAEEQFRLSLKTQENDAGYCGLGEIYLRRGERGAAERAFQSAARLEPSNSQARFRLGALYLAQGRKAEALREYQAGLKSDPENSEAIAAAQKLRAQAGQN
jgi:tetratricopeptide (TPR) repeat protein